MGRTKARVGERIASNIVERVLHRKQAEFFESLTPHVGHSMTVCPDPERPPHRAVQLVCLDCNTVLWEIDNPHYEPTLAPVVELAEFRKERE